MNTVRLRIESNPAGGYSALLFRDGGNTPEATTHIPDDLAVGAAPDVLGPGPADETVRRFVFEHPDSTAFGSIGEYLSSVLLAGDVGARWRSLRQEHPDGLRTLLEVEPANLQLVPWELMSLDDQLLFIDPDFAIVRVRELGDDARQELVPLRVLVVEGTRDDEIQTTAEIQGIKAALPAFRGRIDAEFVSEPDREHLLEANLRIRPHILHFVGHGRNDPTTGEPGLLFRGWLLRRRDIVNLLKPIPRLAVMNACRSSGDEIGVRALTETFLSAGAVAVIGMQGDVRGQAAARFGGALYGMLARDEPIDRAVAAARKAVYAISGATSHERDWALPSLTVRVRPEQVLPLRLGISSQERDRVEQRLFPEIAPFVDRTKHRWKLASAIDPDVGRAEHVLRLVGEPRVGKTWLMQWIRTRAALRGRRVRYVDFRGRSLNFVNALCAIRDTDEDLPSLTPEACSKAFDRFTHDLSELVRGRIPGEPSETPAVEPETAELRLGGDSDTRIFESFRAALSAGTTEERPLLLILDHVSGVQEANFQKWIYRYLIRNVIEGELPNVRVVVVLSGEEQGSHWPSDELRLANEVLVDKIPPGDYVACAEDVLLALEGKLEEKRIALIQALKVNEAESDWSPAILQTIVKIVGRVS